VTVTMRGHFSTDGAPKAGSYPICRDLDQQKQFLVGVFCRALTTVNLSTGWGLSPCDAKIVPGDYFPVLGVGPALGESW
jgi:hypothetical protein